MRRGIRNAWRLAAAGSAATAVLGLLAGGTAKASPDDPYGPEFIVTCHLSHRLPDDPIAHPGEPGDSHLHDFYGSDSTDADSTVRSMQASTTSCDRPLDTAGYWTPTVYRNGKKVHVYAETIYYRNIGRHKDIRAYPLGFKMLAGNPKATSAQSLKVVEWACRIPHDGHKGAWSAKPPVCTNGYKLVMKVWFPDCWNGTDLDSPDHQSHVAYSSHQGVCPAGFPVHIPEIAMTAKLDVPTVPGPPDPGGTAGYYDEAITLSSGSVYTLHGDFWNTWNMPELRRLIQYCLVEFNPCPSPGFN
ncbi:MAG: DUF1996 domain-containing protein [Actinomycetes bacterium]